MNFFDKLNDNLCAWILSCIWDTPTQELQLVCKRWKRIVRSPIFWAYAFRNRIIELGFPRFKTFEIPHFFKAFGVSSNLHYVRLGYGKNNKTIRLTKDMAYYGRTWFFYDKWEKDGAELIDLASGSHLDNLGQHIHITPYYGLKFVFSGIIFVQNSRIRFIRGRLRIIHDSGWELVATDVSSLTHRVNVTVTHGVCAWQVELDYDHDNCRFHDGDLDIFQVVERLKSL